MFLENSRYARIPTVETTTPEGRPVIALKLRQLPAETGELHTVRETDQLDVLAHETYGDGTRFWHIADANTALEANQLVAEPGATILKPRT